MTKRKKKISKKKTLVPKKIVLERSLVTREINNLLSKADALLSENEDLAQHYFEEARNLQMKSRTKFPNYWKKRMCKNCKILLKPGVNARIRFSSKKVIVIKCEKCGGYTRIPYYKVQSDN